MTRRPAGFAPVECVSCGRATGPLARIGADHAGWVCGDCLVRINRANRARHVAGRLLAGVGIVIAIAAACAAVAIITTFVF